MPALATFLAILGWITLGLILTGIGWVFSRWLGKVATLDNGQAGGGPSRPSAADTRTKQVIAHDKVVL